MENPQPTKSPAIEFLGNIDASVLAGLVFLALGGGIISLYYAHIHYLPDIEWSQSIVHLATATFFGGGVALLEALSLFLPGCIWSIFLIFDDELENSFCFEGQAHEVCLLTVWWKIGVWFIGIILVSHFTLLFFQVSDLWYWIAWAVTLAAAGRLMYWRFDKLLTSARAAKPKPEACAVVPQENCEKNKSEQNVGDDKKTRRLFKYTAWFLISILVSQISMLLIHFASGKPTGMDFFKTALLCTLAVLISNHFVAVQYRRSRLQCILVSLLITVLLLLAVDRISLLSSRLVSYFGLGDMSASVDLLLNNEGKEAKEKLRLPERCTSQVDEKLCDVQILSRLGNEYLLKAGDQTFTISKSAVISRISRPQAK